MFATPSASLTFSFLKFKYEPYNVYLHNLQQGSAIFLFFLTLDISARLGFLYIALACLCRFLTYFSTMLFIVWAFRSCEINTLTMCRFCFFHRLETLHYVRFSNRTSKRHVDFHQQFHLTDIWPQQLPDVIIANNVGFICLSFRDNWTSDSEDIDIWRI